MAIGPLVLSAKRATWRGHDPQRDEADHAFTAARFRVLERDRYTCRYCGAISRPQATGRSGWMEAHHLDDDHRNNEESNLVTACAFCHQVAHVGFAGLRGTGVLIYAPELSQAELNGLCHGMVTVMHVPQDNDDLKARKQSATALYEALLLRRREVERRLGVGWSRPERLGELLLRVTPDVYAQRAEWLGGIRLLPVLTHPAFVEACQYWAGLNMRRFPPTSWDRLVEDDVLRYDVPTTPVQ